MADCMHTNYFFIYIIVWYSLLRIVFDIAAAIIIRVHGSGFKGVGLSLFRKK